jgi:hypothetical protein
MVTKKRLKFKMNLNSKRGVYKEMQSESLNKMFLRHITREDRII